MYSLKVTYADGSTHEHSSRDAYELDMSAPLFQNVFSIEFSLDGRLVGGLYHWDKDPFRAECERAGVGAFSPGALTAADADQISPGSHLDDEGREL